MNGCHSRKSRIKCVFLLSCFPSEDNSNAGIFNLRAYNSLIEFVDIKVVVVRAWNPFYRKQNYIYKGVKVNQISLFYIPLDYKNYWVSRISFVHDCFLRFSLWQSLNWFKSNIDKIDIIHSVDLNLNMLIGNRISKFYRVPHIGQAIGADVNTYFSRLLKINSYRAWEDSISGVICNSKALESILLKYSRKKISTRVIYRGVDVQEYQNLHNPNIDVVTKTVKFLFVGGVEGKKECTIGNGKGAFSILKVWKKFEETFDRPPGLLYFGGPNSNSPEVLKYICALKFPESVRIIGNLDPPKLKNIYKNVNVVVIPSLNEGLPNVLLEAMASQCVVLVSNVGGIPEVVRADINGLIFSHSKENDFFNSFVQIDSGMYDFELMGKQARRTVEEYYDSRHYGRLVYEYYISFIY